MNMSRSFLLLQPLREVEVGSTSCNDDCNTNVARHVHFRACYIGQWFVQLVLQWRNKFARQVATKIAQCYSTFIRMLIYFFTKNRTNSIEALVVRDKNNQFLFSVDYLHFKEK